MAILIWTMTGIAIWHFAIFVPDRFWQGIVGAFLGAVFGAVITGALYQALSGRSLGDTDLVTLVVAIPGTLIGLALMYWVGMRRDPDIAFETTGARPGSAE